MHATPRQRTGQVRAGAGHNETKDRCADCGTSGHRMEECKLFKKRSVSERVVIVVDRHIYFRYLQPNQQAFACKTRSNSKIPDCKTPLRHHTLLHDGWSICDQKTRVSPLKQLTLSRLELQVAVMCPAGRNGENRKWLPNRLDHLLERLPVPYRIKWTRSESRRYHTFVAKRIADIQEASSIVSSRWVPGSISNICSRDCTVAELVENS